MSIFALVVMVVTMVACSKSNDGKNTYIGIVITDKADLNLEFGAGGGSETVVFTVSCDWHVSAYDDWVQVSPEEGGIYNTYFIVTVDPNLDVEKRESEVLIRLANGNALKIPVVQKKADIIETPEADAYTMPAEASSINIPISTNVDLTIAISGDAPWLECTASTRAMEDMVLTFEANTNTGDISRVAKVEVLNEDGEPFYEFTIVQSSRNNPLNEITYHSTENRVLDISSVDEAYGAELLVHFYDNNVGRMIFDDVLTVIPDNAFKGYTMLDDITLPSQVTTIGAEAFAGCSSLVSLPLHEGIVNVGNRAFSDCVAIEEAVLPASLQSLGESLFAGCDGELVVYCNIPAQSVDASNAAHWLYGSSFDSITLAAKVGDKALSCYEPLIRVSIADSVAGIGRSAFEGCANLRDIYIDNLTAWCGISFGDAAANPMHLDIDINIDGEVITELVIPSDVRSIGRYAFYNAASLQSITLPNSVTSIGERAFAGCTYADVSLGSGIVAVGNNAFEGCRGDNLYVDCNITDQSVDTESVNNWFHGSQFRNIWFGDLVSTIGQLSFSEYSSLESIYLSDRVEYIGEGAFAGCDNLSFISFSDGLRTVDKHAFYKCTALEEVVLPDGVTHVNGYAFHSCTALESITLPQSVVYIGEYIFDYCSNLSDIYVMPVTPPQLADRYALSGLSSSCRIYVPEQAVADYKKAEFWKYYADMVEGYAY